MIRRPPRSTLSSSSAASDVYKRQLWHRSYNNSAWSTWESLSGQLTASPATVSWADGRIDLFARGTDNALWWRNSSDGGTSWSSWKSLGGQLAATTGPAVSSQHEGP